MTSINCTCPEVELSLKISCTEMDTEVQLGLDVHVCVHKVEVAMIFEACTPEVSMMS